MKQIVQMVEKKRKEIGMPKSLFLEKMGYKEPDSMAVSPAYDFYLEGKRTPTIADLERMCEIVGIDKSLITKEGNLYGNITVEFKLEGVPNIPTIRLLNDVYQEIAMTFINRYPVKIQSESYKRENNNLTIILELDGNIQDINSGVHEMERNFKNWSKNLSFDLKY